MCFYLRWAVRSSSVIQAPRGLFSSGTLAVTRVLVLNRMWRTGCLFTHTEWLCVVRMLLTLWSLKCLVFLMTELSLIQLLKTLLKLTFSPVVHFPEFGSYPHLPHTDQSLATSAHDLPIICLDGGHAHVMGIQRDHWRARTQVKHSHSEIEKQLKLWSTESDSSSSTDRLIVLHD